MNSKACNIICTALSFVIFTLATAVASEPKITKLHKPKMDGGKPLIEVIKNRKSERSFSEKKISEKILSNLLWAAWGISRPESGKRTAPSAINSQEVDLYISTAEGVYLYDANGHALKQILNKDIRAKTGEQEWVGSAPLNLVYVLDLEKGVGDEEEAIFNAAISTGAIVQNVYLFCTSEGLATVVRGSVNRKALAKTMKLNKNQRVLMAQSVGYRGK